MSGRYFSLILGALRDDTKNGFVAERSNDRKYQEILKSTQCLLFAGYVI